MKNTLTHVTTTQEDLVFSLACAILDELNYVGEVHKNVETPLNGIAFVPDLFLPTLGLVIAVDGRIHEHGYEQERFRRQQLYDSNKDIIFKRAGIDVYIVHGHETANRASLSRRLKLLLKDRIANQPSKLHLNQTRKILHRERNKLKLKHPLWNSVIKVGPAGYVLGRKAFHCNRGFKVIFRKKKSVK